MTDKPDANWAEMMRVLLLAAQALDSLEGRAGLGRAVRQGMDFIEEQTKRAERAEAQVEALEIERDLAVAHDRQPYPTAEAYEALAKAHERRGLRLEALVLKAEDEAVAYHAKSVLKVADVEVAQARVGTRDYWNGRRDEAVEWRNRLDALSHPTPCPVLSACDGYGEATGEEDWLRCTICQSEFRPAALAAAGKETP
jgi:hypothetical protein